MKISNPLVGYTVSFLLIPNFLFGNQDQDGIEAGIETESQEQINEETDSLNATSSIPQASGRPIEEIQVLGTRTLYSIRMEIVDEENKIFSMFNELNSDDRFDIFCDNIAPTGSHIKQRVCEPRFVTDMRARMAQDYLRGIGMLNGVLFAVVTGFVGTLWFGDPMLGVVLAAAMIVNLIVAALAGILIPLGLDRAGIDPAVASSVFVTTVTDVVGFLAFLGFATLFLLG